MHSYRLVDLLVNLLSTLYVMLKRLLVQASKFPNVTLVPEFHASATDNMESLNLELMKLRPAPNPCRWASSPLSCMTRRTLDFHRVKIAVPD